MGPEIWRSGPDIEIYLRGSVTACEEMQATGIVDTGASCVCLDISIPLQLGLTPIDRKPMQVADGTWVQAAGFMLQLRIEGLGYDQWTKVFGVKMTYPSSRVLLGRSFLAGYHVTYNGPEEAFHWFRVGPVFYEENDG